MEFNQANYVYKHNEKEFNLMDLDKMSEKIKKFSANPDYEKIKMQKKWSSKIISTLKPQLIAVKFVYYRVILDRTGTRRWISTRICLSS